MPISVSNYKSYNCPDCQITEYIEEDPCKTCPRLKQSEEEIYIPYYEPYSIPDLYAPNTSYDPCNDCPNSIQNGGSGICICSIPYMYGYKWSIS